MGSETTLDLPNSVWEDTLEELNYLNNQFVNTEVILLEKSEEKTQKERQVKIETEEHENIVDNKKAHIEKQVEIKEIKVESRGNSEETHREEQVKIETEDKNIGNNKKSSYRGTCRNKREKKLKTEETVRKPIGKNKLK